MKLWLHFKDMLSQFVSPSNLMEVIDVCLASKPYLHEIELLRMQEIQNKINTIKIEVCSKNKSEDEVSDLRIKMDKLHEIFVKLKNKYIQMSMQVIYDPELPD